jgi:4-hydroxy-tetrahydrodipicolinate reductase
MSPVNQIRVAVVGASGRMGREVMKVVAAQEDMLLVAAVDKSSANKDVGTLIGAEPTGVRIQEDLEAAFLGTKPHVYVDFTNPLSVMGNIAIAVKCGVSGVVGTTGLTSENLEGIEKKAIDSRTNFLVAPNFALGAILMMRFAQQAAAYFPQVEIIELHHDQKLDAPSGTSIKTAEMIKEGRKSLPPSLPTTIEKVKGARGGEMDQIHIHSVRLPGFVAHQEVVFGGQGQTLTIRHDSLNRESFMPGVLMAIRAVLDRPGLTYGLEHLL